MQSPTILFIHYKMLSPAQKKELAKLLGRQPIHVGRMVRNGEMMKISQFKIVVAFLQEKLNIHYPWEQYLFPAQFVPAKNLES